MLAGRGEKGSQRWIRHWINERSVALNGHLQAWESLANFIATPPEWLSPLAPRYDEFRDDLWERVGLPGQPPHKAGW